MRFALFVYDAPGSLDRLGDEEKHQVHAEFVSLSATPGIVGHRLQPASTALTLRIDAGEPVVEARPPRHAGRELIGFYLVETDGVEHALAVAARIPTARLGGVVHVQPLLAEP